MLLVATWLRVWDLGDQSFWYDEAYTWWISTQVSISASLNSSLREFIPPFTYLLWRGWAHIAGTSEVSLRAVSALAGVATVAALSATCRRLTRSRGPLFVALLVGSVAPPLVWAAREMRMYGPLLASVALANLALVEVLFGDKRNRRSWAWVWGVAALVSLYTVVLSAFVLLGQGCFAAATLLHRRQRERSRPVVRALAGPAATAASLYLPWLVPALNRLGENRGYWAGTLTAPVFFQRAVRGITIFRGFPKEGIAVVVGLIVAVFAGLAVPFLAPRGRRLTLYAAATTLLPLVAASVVYRHVPKWELQHTVVFAPGLVMALAAVGTVGNCCRGTSTRSLVRVRWIVAWFGLLGSAGTLAFAGGRLLWDPALRHEDWRGLVSYVEDERTAGEPVVISTGSVAPAWIYYGDDRELVPLPNDLLLDVTHVLHYVDVAPVLNEMLARAPGVWLVGWLDEVTDPTGIVEVLLEDLGSSEPVAAFHGLKLSHYTLERAPDFPPDPPVTEHLGLDLLEDVSLSGVAMPTQPLPADRAVPVRAWWTVTDPARHVGLAYQVSVRVVDGRTNVWGSSDAPAGSGDYRPERWPPDTAVLGRYSVPLLAGMPSGIYSATLTLYALDGRASPEITLGTVTVDRPPSPPPIPDTVTPVTAGGGSGALLLRGARLDSSAAKPCEMLKGWLFWEIGAPLTATQHVRVSLGDGGAGTASLPDVTPMSWQVGDRFLTPFALSVSCRAMPGELPIQISLAAGTGDAVPPADPALWFGPDVTINVDRVFTPPDLMYTAAIQVGDGVAELIGYTLVPAAVRADAPFRVVLYWKAGAPVDDAYTAFVHVVPAGQSGPLIAQHDSWPAEGAKPTFSWVPGEIIADPHPLPGLSAGIYDLRIGVYGPDLVRLPLLTGGEQIVDDLAQLTMIEVR